MNNSTTFSGISVFGQLISLIPSEIIKKIAINLKSDLYTKKFSTWEHLVTMLFSSASNTCSLRDVTNGLLGLEGKLNHLNIKNPPKRSTLCDANKRRDKQVFEQIYYALLEHYKTTLSDSRFKNEYGKHVSIIDSTTIKLFKDILKCVGRKPKSGKSKGGIKVHMQIRADYNLPVLVRFTDATSHDSKFFDEIEFKNDQIYLFDRGYNNYEKFEKFNKEDISFVTRLKHNASYTKLIENELSENTSSSILLDEQIKLPIKDKNSPRDIELRKVVYWDDKNNVCYEFITNIKDLESEQIANLYKCRWQIELLNKQLKQNLPLDYFLGDNENAICIQIWCALIWNLLITVLKKQIQKKKWAFSNIISITRLHLFNYLNIFTFLSDPNNHYKKKQNLALPSLFDPLA